MMDGVMCEDIRIGILVRTELREDNSMWRKKGSLGPAMTFSSWIIVSAGGIEKFFLEWEREPT